MAKLPETHHPSSPPLQEEEDDDNLKIKLFQLPPELFLEPLYRAPVKSLMKFRATSKFSCALVDNPVFVEFYLRYNKSRNTALIADNSFEENGRRTFSLLRVDAPPSHIHHHIDNQIKVRRNFSPPNFFEFSKNMILAGSVNGIVCVTNEKDFAETFVGLWNPSRKVWKAIELPSTKSWKNKSVGLGFDSETNDYKIICIVPVPHGGSRSKIQIYSNNQDMWAQCNLEGIVPFRPQETLNCKFIVHGVPYWLGHNWQLGDFQFFARVDPCTGLYRTFQYPQDVNPDLVHLVNLRESVAALVKCPSKYASVISVDLYLMEEKCGSWMKLYCIGSFECDRMWIPQCMGTGEIVIVKWKHFGDNVTCVSATLIPVRCFITLKLRSLIHSGSCPTLMWRALYVSQE